MGTLGRADTVSYVWLVLLDQLRGINTERVIATYNIQKTLFCANTERSVTL